MANERKIGSKYGTFYFSYISGGNNKPMIDIYLEEKFIGRVSYINLKTASDLELLQLASEI